MGTIFDCAGEYPALIDTKMAILENYVNFGANLWNQKNGDDYRTTLIWAPKSELDFNQEFIDKAFLLQAYLHDYGLAGNPQAAGVYWDELVEEDEQIQEYNEQHPEDQKDSKLDTVIWIVTVTTNPAYEDYINKAVLPLGRKAAESWVSIYFGDAWGMHY